MGGYAKKIYAAAILLLVVGGMAWGYMGMLGKNPVAQALGKWAWVVYGLVGISAIVVLARGRDAYLPFLGPTVFPCAALEDKIPANADTEVVVQVRPGAKVLYWGAEPGMEGMKELKTWREAYGAYENVGVATADASGHAILRLRKPQPYKVPTKGRLEAHVHYRLCEKAGWLSQVETHMLHTEAFQDVPVPEPAAPIIPVVASTPELPVIADPISGLPTAIPAAILKEEDDKKEEVATADIASNTATVGADTETPSPVEGFSNEPLYSSHAAEGSSIPTLMSEDPRLQRLRTTVETNAIKMTDAMAYAGPSGFGGTDLDMAFQIPERVGAPASR